MELLPKETKVNRVYKKDFYGETDERHAVC